MNSKIAIIGGGNLGTAIAQGLIKSDFSIPSDIIITKRNISSLKGELPAGVKVSDDNVKAVVASNIIILAVKPFQIAGVMEAIAPVLTKKQVLVSVITGVTLSDLKEMAKIDLPVFRAMPNTAVAIEQSMTCVSSDNASDKQVQLVTRMFSTVGKVVTIDDKLMDAATVLGACGTAYAMRYIRANIQAGIEIGFDAKTANLIAAQTVKGAAELLLKNGSHPEQEIDKVTTPKGCTIVGLNEMEHRGFSSSLIRGVIASYKKIAKD
ncbi:pyrroline-5-carboxylate reductase [Niabella ginsenosidivorans]|uniref:Pyrroline-5-carboxylate reductase n=1 Tax=Niabella ginsenosidivorans TaxID=1176587 RepID=A0A1A9HYE3_9BACT|nr:pyrroline-5-carboxylate reductase [Niabella ginsenosidivorans]ANH80105.1 pyrroline-5-carboxylate reductase [Niabella ginsenosidivorans]